jgi:ligand-binding SRPBCC domain-containing protein
MIFSCYKSSNTLLMPTIHLTTFVAAPADRVFDLARSIDLHRKRPLSFTDEMVDGDFRSMKHEHHFKRIDNGTLLIDLFHFETPYGAIGKLVNQLYLTRYMKKLLETRNQHIKEYAESEKWKFLLNK